jgi:hypothetical protein
MATKRPQSPGPAKPRVQPKTPKPTAPAPKPVPKVAGPSSKVTGPNFGHATPEPKPTSKQTPKPAPGGTPPVPRPVPTGHPQVTPKVGDMHRVDPKFSLNIGGVRPPGDGVVRSQIKVPICPAPTLTDEVLLEDTAQATKRFYLPRYKVAMDHQRYQISFDQDDRGWFLAVNLTKFSAPSIASAAQSAQEIQHRVAVLLRFNQMIGNQAAAHEELSFQEVIPLNDGVLRATLRLESLQLRDLLYQALSDRTFGTTLLVRRAVTVAVPVPVPLPVLMPGRPPMSVPPRPPAPLYRQVERTVDQVVEPTPFVFSPDLHKYIFAGVKPVSPVGPALTRYQVHWTDGRSHSYYQDGGRSHVFYFLPDCFKIARRQNGKHEPLMSVSFGQAASAADLKVTFAFIAVPYVNAQRLQAAAEQLRASIKGNLPQGVAGPQFEPLLSAPDRTHFSLTYPGCDSSRGPCELRETASVDLRSGIHDSLQLSLPGFQTLYDALFSPSSAVLTGKVDVDLGPDSGEEIPVIASLSDAVGDFLAYRDQPLGDAAAEPADESSAADSDAIKASVTSAIGDAVKGDVSGAVGDIVGGLAGKLLGGKKDKKKKGKPAAPSAPPERGVQATLQNIIESPVEIRSLDATLVRNQERLPAAIDGLDLTQPVQIPPGQGVTFNVIPASPVAAGAPVHAEYDLSGAYPVPDRDAIWNETVDPTTTASYLTTITVKTPDATFAGPSDDPTRQIVSMVVDFDSGVSAELNASKPEVNVDLPRPVASYVLRKAGADEYRYKLTIIRANGEQARDPDWRPPETTTVLFPPVA